jgi:hypothetical protein
MLAVFLTLQTDIVHAAVHCTLRNDKHYTSSATSVQNVTALYMMHKRAVCALYMYSIE